MADYAPTPLFFPQMVILEYNLGYPDSYKSGSISNLSNLHWANGSLLLQPILAQLKTNRLQIDKTMVSCLGPEDNLYVYIGNDPLPISAAVPADYIRNGKVGSRQLTLKFRYTGKSETQHGYQHEDDLGKAAHRTKERKIGYIIEKVARWRNLYNGVVNSKGEHIRMTLEESAMQVGISKKSLDDYLLQLRYALHSFGRRFGFNFQEHKDEKVGVLRAYVKKYKAVEHEIERFRTDQSMEPSELLQNALMTKGTVACRSVKCCQPPSYLVQKVTEHPKFASV